MCKQIKVKNKEAFNCDGCSQIICKECGELTASEIKVLQLTGGRCMKFYCPKCLKGETFELLQKLLESKESMIEDKMEIIRLLKDEIEHLKKEKTTTQHMGYNMAVRKQKEETIIIKPKDNNQASEVTKRKIEEKIDPCSLGVGVSRMKYVRDGGVAIKCNEKQRGEVKNVCESIKSSLGQSYEVQIPTKKNPRIVVFDISPTELQDTENLMEKIIIQNNITTDINDRELKMVHSYKNKKGMMNIILEVDKKTYSCIETKEKIHIGWKSCFYKDSVNVKQCFNCWKFGHIAKDCKKEEPTCPTCAGKHKGAECQSSYICCVNCKYAMEVLKVPNINMEHKANDRICEAYRRIVDQLQEKIDYPDISNKQNKK